MTGYAHVLASSQNQDLAAFISTTSLPKRGVARRYFPNGKKYAALRKIAVFRWNPTAGRSTLKQSWQRAR